MLNVSYKNRIGYYTKVQNSPGETRKFRNWICHANCLWADIYFYKVEEDYERFGIKHHKGEKMAHLGSFFGDNIHLKACVENGIYDGCDDFHFFADEMNKEIWAAVKILAEAGKKVTIVKSQKKQNTRARATD